jgi:patatin-like phospholipase/acyl hydrolase
LRLPCSAQQLVSIYEKKGSIIFPNNSLSGSLGNLSGSLGNRWTKLIKTQVHFSNPQYHNDGLKEVLQQEFGVQETLGDLAPNLVLITSYDALNRKPLLMCNWHKDWAYLPIWQACISSASAPTFFPSFDLDLPDLDNPGNYMKINAIDGGVFANNPVTCAISQAFDLCDHPIPNTSFWMPSDKREEFRSSLSILSIGTGKYTRQIQYQQSKDWGTLEWIAPLIDVMFDGSNAINNQIVSCLIENHKAYLRLQPILAQGKGSDDIDDASPQNMSALIKTAQEYVNSRQIQAQIDQFLA